MTAIEKPGMLWKQVTQVTNGASNTYHKIKGQHLIIQICYLFVHYKTLAGILLFGTHAPLASSSEMKNKYWTDV